MSVNLTELFGAGYDNLLEAQVDKSPSEVVVSDNGATFYIVEMKFSKIDCSLLGMKSL